MAIAERILGSTSRAELEAHGRGHLGPVALAKRCVQAARTESLHIYISSGLPQMEQRLGFPCFTPMRPHIVRGQGPSASATASSCLTHRVNVYDNCEAITGG
jgi:hypothetical protein